MAFCEVSPHVIESCTLRKKENTENSFSNTSVRFLWDEDDGHVKYSFT